MQTTIKPRESSEDLRGFIVKNDPYGDRTHVSAVKGPCLNHLTNGPFCVTKIIIAVLKKLSRVN